MTMQSKYFFTALILALAASAPLQASTLPTGDSLSIELDPVNGAVHGPLGATVGWGFTVTWSSVDGHWLYFTGSGIGSVAPGGFESNPSVLQLYTDNIGAQGGPVNFAIDPGSGVWTNLFDGVSQGVGFYIITSDSNQVGANDSGQITFYYNVTDLDPTLPGSVNLGAGSYYGSSTQFSVTVVDSVPEPNSLGLLLSGAAVLFAVARRAQRRRTAT